MMQDEVRTHAETLKTEAAKIEASLSDLHQQIEDALEGLALAKALGSAEVIDAEYQAFARLEEAFRMRRQAAKRLRREAEAVLAALAPAERHIATKSHQHTRVHIQIGALQPKKPDTLHAEARDGNMWATIDLVALYSLHYPGGYVLEYAYERINQAANRKLSRKQQERGDDLLHLLGERVTQAMEETGWRPTAARFDGNVVWRYQPRQTQQPS